MKGKCRERGNLPVWSVEDYEKLCIYDLVKETKITNNEIPACKLHQKRKRVGFLPKLKSYKVH